MSEMVGSASRGSSGPSPKTSCRTSSMTRSFSRILRGVFSSSTSFATAERTSLRTRSLATDDNASRLIRSSSFRCNRNFNSWYSGVYDCGLKSLLTHSFSRNDNAVPAIFSPDSEKRVLSLGSLVLGAGNFHCQTAKLLAEDGAGRQQFAFGVRFIQSRIVAGQRHVNSRSQHGLQLLHRHVVTFRSAIQNQSQLILPKAAVQKTLH